MPIQKFEVTLNTSNENIEDVKRKLEYKLSNWLDDISFITGKSEILKSVKILNTETK